MSYPRHTLMLSMPRKSNPYFGAHIDASVVPGTIVQPTGPRKLRFQNITGNPFGTITGGPNIVPSALTGRAVAPTIIPTPAVLRNPTVGPPAPVARPRPIVPGPRQPAAVVGQPVMNRRHHAHAPRVPGVPVGRGHRH